MHIKRKTFKPADYVVMILTIMFPVILATVKIAIEKRRARKAAMAAQQQAGDTASSVSSDTNAAATSHETGANKAAEAENAGASTMVTPRTLNNEEEAVPDMLTGGRRMNYITVALSMLGFTVNGAFVIGVPADVYYNGATFALIGIAWIIVIPLAAHVFVPIMHKLQLITAYEYFGRRFHVVVRSLCSLMFTICAILLLGIYLYAPVLALAQVSTMNVGGSAVLFAVLCSLYVMQGGINTIVWVDVFQIIIIFPLLVILLSVGSSKVGHDEVWARVAAGNRGLNTWTETLALGPFRQQHTIASQIVGQIFIWLPMYTLNQAILQRCLAVDNMRKVKLAMYINLFLSLVALVLLTLVGLVMYGFYYECDPFTHGMIKRKDQILQLFIMDIFGSYPGLPGLFTGAIFLAARGAIAAAMNSVTGVFLEDFLKPIWHVISKGTPLSFRASMWAYRITVIVFAILTIAVSFSGPTFNRSIVALPINVIATFISPIFGVFVMALLFRWVNTAAAMTGAISGLFMTFWLALGYNIYGSPYYNLPLNTNCSAHNVVTATFIPSTFMTSPATTAASQTYAPLQGFYDMSYAWHGLVGFAVACMATTIVSFISRLVCKGDKTDSAEVDKSVYLSKKQFLICCRPRVKHTPPPPPAATFDSPSTYHDIISTRC